MKKDLVEMKVRGVAVDRGDGLPIVLLLDEEGGAGIPLPVGPFEASAIIIELEGISPPRPLTHDLLASTFRESGLVLERAELFGARGEGAQARLVYRRGLSRRRKEVRPSDAVALAIRLKAPICAEKELLDTKASVEAALGGLVPRHDGEGRYYRSYSRGL
jgi:bifunctional DNase/RNase